ncbi:hypothetical protein FDECE_14363 [Fusarium decemcellulare]|nr:hypothetical protein FDECE_14363 [Fusarium decemcellulare]
MTFENDPVIPGTVRLIRGGDDVEDSTFVLSPTPSSDPNDPLNWSMWRKYLNFGLTIAISIAVFTNLSIQVVFWQQMTNDLGVTITQLARAQSTQLAGLAVGCIFFIPFAIKYGRRSVYLGSTAALAAASWWTGRMHSVAEVFITAFITGLAGAINETAVQMMIADLFFVHQRGTVNGLYFVAVNCGSFITPLAAGSQAAAQGWRWSYYSLAIALTLMFVAFLFLFEETKYVPTLEGDPGRIDADQTLPKDDVGWEKAKTANDLIPVTTSVDSPVTHNTWRQRLRFTTVTGEPLLKLLVLPLHVVAFPHVLFTSLQFASAICGLVLYLATVSIVFSKPPYNFTTAGVGYMSIGPFIGNVFGSIYGGPFSDWIIMKLTKRNHGIFQPEMRLYTLGLSVIATVGGIIMYGVTAARGMHWIYPSIGGALFAFGIGSNGDITFTLVIDSYHELTAEAFVGVAFIRNAFSVGVPFALVPWLKTMGLQNMLIVYGCIAGVIGLLHIPMIIWGRSIRAALASRYWRLVEERASL